MTQRRPSGGNAVMPITGPRPDTRGREVNKRFIALAAGAATLAAAPVALSHPSVYEVTPQKYTGGALSDDSLRYLVTQHGYPAVFTESNSVTTGGVLNFARLPSGWRTANPTRSGWLTQGNTNLQVHATCQNVTALQNTTNILAWQGSDPFYNYIPFQPTSVGLDDEDERDDWIRVVKDTTGVDLATLATEAQLTAACQGLGGTFKASDTYRTRPEGVASAVVADKTAPLNARIAELQAEVAGKVSDLARKTADHMAAVLRMDAFTVKFASDDLSRAAVARDGIRVVVSGPRGETARVDVRVTEGAAKRLGLPRDVGFAIGTPGTDGTVTLTVRPGKGALRAIRASDGPAPLVAEVRAARKPGTDRATLAG